MRKRSKKKGGQREKERCHCKSLVNLDGNDGKRMRRWHQVFAYWYLVPRWGESAHRELQRSCASITTRHHQSAFPRKSRFKSHDVTGFVKCPGKPKGVTSSQYCILITSSKSPVVVIVVIVPSHQSPLLLLILLLSLLHRLGGN